MEKISHKEKPFNQRQKESTDILFKYPDRICIFIEKKESCKSLPDLERHKYLVPNTITASQFISVIRKKLEITKETALFFYINNNILSGNSIINDIYNKYRNLDGFLYIKYAGEKCFG